MLVFSGIHRIIYFYNLNTLPYLLVLMVNKFYGSMKLAFANGGDQNNNTIPERAICEQFNIELMYLSLFDEGAFAFIPFITRDSSSTVEAETTTNYSVS